MPGQNDGSELDAATEDAFREQVRTFMEANCSRTGDRSGSIGDDDPEGIAAAKAFQGSMADAGLAGLTFPSEFGGAGLTSRHQELFNQEVQGWYLPTTPLSISHGMCLPVLNQFGTEDQKARFMPDNISGASIWCQMFSEPGAGSDVASLSTRAVRDGDEWILNGSKVWTSRGTYARWGMCLARTDVSLAKHRGLTMFAVDMTAPGVEIRPLEQINGDRHFTEVFVSDVRVADADRIGDLGAGWGLTVETLAHERATIGGRAFGGGDDEEHGLPSWMEDWRAAGHLADPVARQRAMRAFILHRVNQLTVARAAAALVEGEAPGPSGSGAKLRSVAAFKSRAYLGKDLSGPAGMLSDADGHLEFLTAPSMSIRGGTDEVQRNIVGERILGLPGEPRVDKDAAYADLKKSR